MSACSTTARQRRRYPAIGALAVAVVAALGAACSPDDGTSLDTGDTTAIQPAAVDAPAGDTGTSEPSGTRGFGTVHPALVGTWNGGLGDEQRCRWDIRPDGSYRVGSRGCRGHGHEHGHLKVRGTTMTFLPEGSEPYETDWSVFTVGGITTLHLERGAWSFVQG